MQKAAFACGSLVLSVYCISFFRPAGRKKDIQRLGYAACYVLIIIAKCIENTLPAIRSRSALPIARLLAYDWAGGNFATSANITNGAAQ
jgi:hypothetical protein